MILSGCCERGESMDAAVYVCVCMYVRMILSCCCEGGESMDAAVRVCVCMCVYVCMKDFVAR